jgi:hypothetical protein
VVKCSLVPKASCTCYQNLPVKQPSLSETIVLGTPCNLTICLKKTSTSLRTGQVSLIGKKCVVFVSRSTITQMASWPLLSLKPCHKIHRDVLPLPLRNRKWLELTSWSLMLNLHLLTDLASSHKRCHIRSQSIPPEMLSEILVHLTRSWMNRVRCSMSLL